MTKAESMEGREIATEVTARGAARAGERGTRTGRTWTRHVATWMRHGHVWLGVLGSMALIVICITGILLNHKRPLGLMPDVENPEARSLGEALSLRELVTRAEDAVAPEGEPPVVDRMDVRPSDGLVKVRFKDRVVTEVTLDLATGAVLHVGARNDAFLEKVHSGEIFGDRGTLISDAAAVILTLLLVSGYWLWLYPRRRT